MTVYFKKEEGRSAKQITEAQNKIHEDRYKLEEVDRRRRSRDWIVHFVAIFFIFSMFSNR